MLSKDLAGELEKLKVTIHQVSRKILRMNKRLAKVFGFAVVKRLIEALGGTLHLRVKRARNNFQMR